MTVESEADRHARLARDWMTIWQSEIAVLGSDREVLHAAESALAWWETLGASFMSLSGGGGGDRAGKHAGAAAGADAPTRPATAAAPSAARATADAPRGCDGSGGDGSSGGCPDPRDALIDQLLRRVAALERRLGDESGADRSALGS